MLGLPPVEGDENQAVLTKKIFFLSLLCGVVDRSAN